MRAHTRLPVGICVWPEPSPNAPRTVSFPDYIREILAHAGVCCAEVAPATLLSTLPELRLLVTVGETALPEEERSALREWVKAGGAWLSVGGVCGLADVFGVEVEPPPACVWGVRTSTLGEGYMRPDHPLHPVLGNLLTPLHYFNGIPVRAAGGQVLASVLDAHQHPTHRAALVEAYYGDGHTVLLAPDVTGTVVRIQQGTAVTRDGVPAPDGSGATTDGVLKSDDGAVLDWLFDRQPVHGVPGYIAFTLPVADRWREILIRSILLLAKGRRIPLPLLWLYPRNLPALAQMSHDSDLNEPENATALLEVLRTADINTTWCIVLPGYDTETIAAIRNAGHELAMHYDAMSPGTNWSEAEFDRQWQALKGLLGREPVTNKNHYLRWEGDTEFFSWLAHRGIRFDQSKGASKTGEAGFNFGTCHPYLPVDTAGRRLDVLELPTPTQDLEVFAPKELLQPLLDAVLSHHGVLHLLFHPAHILKDGVEPALTGAVEAARGRGMEWWTAERIDRWERARRAVEWSAGPQPGDCRLNAGTTMEGATILWLLPDNETVTLDGEETATVEVERWGFRFRAVVADISEGEHSLTIHQPPLTPH